MATPRDLSCLCPSFLDIPFMDTINNDKTQEQIKIFFDTWVDTVGMKISAHICLRIILLRSVKADMIMLIMLIMHALVCLF